MDIDGTKLHAHIVALYPICRSITGAGLRQTLSYIADRTDLAIHHVPTGTPVLDWEVPPEWVVRGGQIRNLAGEVLVDFEACNLHLVQYSRPVDAVVSREELDAHLHSLPAQPDLIPYRTSYYADNWGFCLADRERQALTDPSYRVCVDTELKPGVLSYGEAVIPGAEPAEVLFSIHCCHPSLANDNLSSIAIAIELIRVLAARARRRFTYRFVFVPGTIGAITWLHFNRDAAKRVRHGLVLSCLGDPGAATYKQSRRGDAAIDRYAAHLLTTGGRQGSIVPFEPYGYDERQYCSPGFNLPVGCLMRSRNGTFPEYHTSADNPGFVTAAALAESTQMLLEFINLIEGDANPVSTAPYGEPQLGRRGLYKAIGGGSEDGASARFDQMTLLWVLNQADGGHSLLDIAERSGKPFSSVAAAAEALEKAGLLRYGPEGKSGRNEA